MSEDENNLQSLASDRAILIYKMISAAYSFAYFGFVTIQPLIINQILKKILPENTTGFFDERNSLQISILIISLRLIFQVILETPSGAFADNHGRMTTVRNSFLFRFFSMLFFVGAFFFAPEVPQSGLSQIAVIIIVALIFAEIFMAIGDALFSGSMDAWLVDTVTHCGNLQLHKQNSIGNKISETFSSSVMQQNIAIMISMPFFLLLYLYIGNEKSGVNIYTTTIIVAVIFLGAGVLAHDARSEIYRHTVEWRERSSVSIRHTLKQSWELIRTTKTLFWWIILMASPFGAWVIVSWTWPILLDGIVLPSTHPSSATSEENSSQTANFILIAFSMIVALARVGGSWFCHSLQQHFNPYRGLRAALILNLIILSLGAVFLWKIPVDPAPPSGVEFKIPAGVAIFLLSLVAAKALEEIVKIFTKVVLSRIITDSTVRATAISFQSLVASLFPFFFILLSVSMSFDKSSNNPKKTVGVGIIVLVSSLSGLILALIATVKLYKPMSLSLSKDIIHEDAGGFND